MKTTFCVAPSGGGDNHNNCNPATGTPPGSTAGTCTRSDFKCWWYLPKVWKTDCPSTCGNEGAIRYDATWASTERAEPTDYWTPCLTLGLPAGSLIIDDVPRTAPAIRGGCDNSGWTNSGSLTFTFGKNSAGKEVSKADFHQLGNGFGGHQWFAYARKSSETAFKVTGTWTLGQQINGAAKVFVHIPDHYASAKEAKYEIETAKGTKSRIINLDGTGNRWTSLGGFLFNGTPKVQLSTVMESGTGKETVAWDAIAFQPIQGNYVEHTVEAVALFDENQDIDADPVSTWIMNTPLKSRQALYDWALNVTGSVIALPTRQNGPAASCVMSPVKEAMQRWRQEVIEAGTDPVNHQPGKGIANWVHFANPYTDRPTSPTKPARFDTDDTSHKIKSFVKVSFIADGAGKIINGSEDVNFEHRTGNTTLPHFVLDSLSALEQGYGYTAPDLSYRIANLNHHDGRLTATNPNSDGILPGRAWIDKGVSTLADEQGKTTSGDSSCIKVRYASGGIIGYGPMLGTDVPGRVEAWRTRIHYDALEADNNGNPLNPKVPQAVSRVADEIYNAFFKSGNTGSIFYNAPPIWQQLEFLLCGDGSL
ncbi:hypothetical protein ACQPYK_48645 (plasmid) [Streptosporangium sp. CA-135522]|uniref:golvesin C-terminal-like domain-containing protein n=1 Tax=Streptosporangium sp. CA-135522 TaxID=3240072 RepID=UPI003D9176B2